MFRNAFARAAILLLLTAAVFPVMASRYAYIPRSGANQVSVLDTQTNTFGANIAVGAAPWGVAVHPAGTRVYVPASGSNTVAVINTATNTVIANVTVGNNPFHAAVSPDGTEVYVPNYSSGTVSVINTATNTVSATISGMSNPNAVAYSPSGRFVYVTSYGSGALYVINTATRTFTTVAGMSTQSEGIAVHPSGRYVYTVSNNSNVAAILDTTTNTIATTANIGNAQWGVAVHPNGRYFYVTRGGDELRVFRTSDNVQVALVDVGTGTRSPTGISLSPSGNFAYVSNRGTASVTVVNTVTNAVATTIATTSAPYALGDSIQRPLFGHGSISTGENHSCRVRADQSVDCWGRNDAGQATAPVTGSFMQVATGSAHSCGLRTNGTVICWGNNPYGQATPASGTFQKLASGARHVCGIRSDSSVACWGEADQGKTTVPAGLNNFQDISAGTSHTCGLRSTGLITCWGRNVELQGNPLPGSFIQVVAGASVTCGLRSDGVALCWGDATGGKTTPVPVPLATTKFTKLFARNNVVCGLTIDGALSCWGPDVEGEKFPPAVVHADAAIGRYHGCSLSALGVAQCWGWNTYGQAPQFGLNLTDVADGTVGSAYPTQQFAMVVTNPGTRSPYVPRTPVYALVSGSLPAGLVLSAAGQLSGAPTAAGTFNFAVQAEDANGFIAERAYSMVVGTNDATAPEITAQLSGTAGNNGWYRGNVVVSWTVSDPESTVTSTTGCGPLVISTETAGTVVTCSATSAGGTASGTVTVKLDKTAPLGLPTVSNARPLLNEPITLQANGSDALSGLASETCDAVPTNVVSLVTKRVNCTITDVAGNVAVRQVAYRVVYGFQGFFDTAVNPGYWNSAGLGQNITLKFRVVDFNGAAVTSLTSASIATSNLACPTKISMQTPTSASVPGLVHTVDGNYEFTWTTPASAACLRLVLELGDGNVNNRLAYQFQ